MLRGRQDVPARLDSGLPPFLRLAAFAVLKPLGLPHFGSAGCAGCETRSWHAARTTSTPGRLPRTPATWGSAPTTPSSWGLWCRCMPDALPTLRTGVQLRLTAGWWTSYRAACCARQAATTLQGLGHPMLTTTVIVAQHDQHVCQAGLELVSFASGIRVWGEA